MTKNHNADDHGRERTLVTYRGREVFLDELPADAGPKLGEGIGVTEAEWEEFWKALHE